MTSVALPSVNSSTPATGWPRQRWVALRKALTRDGGAPVEIEFAEVVQALQTGIKGVTAHLKILFEAGLPALGIGDEQVAQRFRRANGAGLRP